MFQAGSIASLIQCAYDGQIDLNELSKHGDFGLGTVDRIDGELIIVDGEFYRADAKGNIQKIDLNKKTPFALTTFFKADDEFNLKSIADLKEMEKKIDARLESLNYIYAIRIDGVFSYVQMRSEAPQPKPYKPFTETVLELQNVFEAHDSEGTMVAVRFPDYIGTLNVPGYHLHYIDKDRKIGGHVYDLAIKAATVKICTIRRYTTDFLVGNPYFVAANLNKVGDKEIDTIEKLSK